MSFAFPTTLVLDDANRTDENPISQGGLWTTISELTSLRVVSNQIGSNAAYGGSYRGLWADAEVFCTFSVLGGDMLLTTRYQDAGGASPIRDSRRRGYQLTAATATYALTRMDDGGSGASLITATAWPGGNIAAGDSMGLRSMGGAHEIWLKRSSASWQLVTTYTDSTYTNAGAIALQFSGATLRGDDFGGGAVGIPITQGIAPLRWR